MKKFRPRATTNKLYPLHSLNRTVNCFRWFSAVHAQRVGGCLCEWWRLFAAWLTKCDCALWFLLLFSCFLYSAPSSGFVLEVRALQLFHYCYYYYYYYQKFNLSKSVVGLNFALHAVPAYRASTYSVLPSQLVQLHFPQISPILNGGMCSISSESKFVLVCGRNTFCITLI